MYYATGIQDYLIGFINLANGTFIPLLMALALLFFVFNAFRYFIMSGDNEQGKEQAKSLALYGIAAFVLIISFWGLVNLLVSGLGVGGDNYVTPDYIDYNLY